MTIRNRSGTVSVSLPGFHPIKTFQMYRMAKKTKEWLDANPDRAQEVVKAFEDAGAKVTYAEART